MTTLPAGVLPGFSISILRERTFGEVNTPIGVNGRVSGFGLGLPAFVRVSLEGPAHNPEVRNFDTFSSPLGDYTVSILAEKDGEYIVRAKASFEPFFFGPSLLESASPPLIIGTPVNGQVELDINGRRQRVAQPPQTRVELSAPISIGVSPIITLPGGAPAAGGGFGGFLPFFGAPGVAPDVGQVLVPIAAPTAPLPDLPPPEQQEVISGRILNFEI